MTTGNMKKVFAAQLDCLKLDRAGTIERAAEILADIAEQLAETEARAKVAEKQASEFYQNLETTLQLLTEVRGEMQANYQSLPGYLGDITDMAMAEQRKVVSRSGGKAKHLRTEQIKQEIKELHWKPWQANLSVYAKKSAFDKAMLDKYDGEIDDIQTISKWRREFQK